MDEEMDESSEGLADEMTGFSSEGGLVYEEHCDTEFGPQIDAQAWSTGQPEAVTPYREERLWPWSTVIHAAAIGFGVLLIAAVVLVVSSGALSQSPETSVSTPAPPPTLKPVAADDPPPPPFTPNMNVADHTTPDGMFLQGVRLAPWSYADNAAAINDAHDWCHTMRRYGVSPTYAARSLWNKYAVLPGYPDYPTTVRIVNAAVAAYCPDVA